MGRSPRSTSLGLPATLATVQAIRVLRLLAKRPLRFNRLKDATGANAKSLSHALQVLAGDGCISRTVLVDGSPGVEYAVTAHGKRLLSIVDEIDRWAEAK